MTQSILTRAKYVQQSEKKWSISLKFYLLCVTYIERMHTLRYMIKKGTF